MQEFVNGLVQIFITIIIISFVVVIYTTIMMWKIFKKANKPGWAAAIPFYNLYILTEITWGNGWLFLILVSDGIAYTMSLPEIILSIIDIIVLVFSIMTIVRLARAFGKDNGFAAGLVFLGLIFITILAFDSSKYLGAPSKNGSTNSTSNPQPIPNNNMESQPQQPISPNSVVEPQQPISQNIGACPSCGAQLQPGTQICPSCGTRIIN